MDKNTDRKGRLRSKIISFRMSPEESEQLDAFVKISGLTKQDYIISRVLQRDIVVHGSPRTYKALKDQIAAVLEKLEQREDLKDFDETLAVIEQINETLRGFKNNPD
ncbi:MAG: hypothetical protein K2J76_01850 [Oscillospiraceae bacterium]|nr:hypothetical protein [Oscillospiraceae bacterium]